jgi:hypothetical protein
LWDDSLLHVGVTETLDEAPAVVILLDQADLFVQLEPQFVFEGRHEGVADHHGSR